jgi:hypothetical protein
MTACDIGMIAIDTLFIDRATLAIISKIEGGSDRSALEGKVQHAPSLKFRPGNRVRRT